MLYSSAHIAYQVAETTSSWLSLVTCLIISFRIKGESNNNVTNRMLLHLFIANIFQAIGYGKLARFSSTIR